MFFWYTFIIFILAINLLCDIIKNKTICNIFLFIMFFFMLFIQAFRENVGYDFEQYRNLYYIAPSIESWIENSSNLLSSSWIVEPTITIFSELFRFMGFNYHALFILYSVLTMIFIIKGLYFYGNKNVIFVLIGLSIFALNRDLYFLTFSIIRQAVAGAICFWASKYINIDTKKFILSVLIASMFHYSAIIMLSYIFFRYLRIKTRTMIITIIIVFFMTLTGVIKNIMIILLQSTGFYVGYLDFNTVAVGGIYLEILLFFIVIYWRKNTMEDNFLFNIAFLNSIFYICSISLNTMFTRIALYTSIFYIVLFPKVLLRFKYGLLMKYIIYIIFAIFLITNLNGYNEQSKTDFRANIEYDYTLDIFE